MLRIIFYLAVAMLDLIGEDKGKEACDDVVQQEVVFVAVTSREVQQCDCYKVVYRKP